MLLISNVFFDLLGIGGDSWQWLEYLYFVFFCGVFFVVLIVEGVFGCC